MFAKVLLDVPANDGIFDYEVPSDGMDSVRVGSMVAVPFGPGLMQGIVLQLSENSDIPKIKRIVQLIDALPVITDAQLELAKILSNRCLAPLSACVNSLLSEKIRRISAITYKLVGSFDPASARQLAFNKEVDAVVPLRIQLLTYLSDNEGGMTANKLNQVLGKTKWKTAMRTLIREGLVRSEQSFKLPVSAPLYQKKVRLAIDPDQLESIFHSLSRTESARNRRTHILTALRASPDGIRARKLLDQTGGINADLKFLEKEKIINIALEEDWRNAELIRSDDYQGASVTLNQEQQSALNIILDGMRGSGEKTPILIHGVTGSGKTEIYIRAAESAVAAGRQVLVLVPEISLTPQILQRFSQRFPNQVGVYHSKLSDGQRYDTWYRGRNGMFRVIVGPRSALSVPLSELGLIIVDECHDDSYYQTDQMPYFSAVQAALDYARISNAQLVLGSATPTVSQVYKARQSKWHYVQLQKRASGVLTPLIHVVDMRQELKAGNRSVFSRVLMAELEKSLFLKKQSILFLNRRGSAGYTFCHSCGHDFRCPRCDIPLTWHQNQGLLSCHFCGYSEIVPAHCPECGKAEIRQFGTGVEQVERLIRQANPEARLLRMDSETTANRGDYERILDQFSNHEADILIGTQMVSKGLDFPDVRLVGILLADVGMNFHDYRVDEHSFQILTQVAGRAGRANDQGVAVLQTFQPGRYSIRAAVKSDYWGFYNRELAYRREIGYPPFSRLVRILISNQDLQTAEKRAYDLQNQIRSVIHADKRIATHVIGPAPCFFPRLNGKYRWHIILRGPNPVEIVKKVDTRGLKVEIDPPSVL